EEFREDLRPLSAGRARVGTGNDAARRVLSATELAPLTQLHDGRSLLAVAQTFGTIALAIAFGVWVWPSAWVALSVLVIGVQQHALFILAHESAHYRLLKSRALNDALGRAIGMASGISMCTYRVIHRLHHNNLYTEEDPDTAIHGGYPRGVAYLWKKLALDLAGVNAWKTFAYFFGAPALNTDTQRAARPLDDTSSALRASARRDRWLVVAFHLGAPLLAFALGGLHALLLYAVLWLLPMLTVLQPILRLRAIAEHGAVTDLSSPLTAARCNRTWGSIGNTIARVLLFPHHVNHHLEHHLYPAVPHYHLPRLHRMLHDKGVLAGAEVRDVGATMRTVFAPRPS
ncbi:MAG TPA: fatty acid desaturase family protein, partial [Burkholderiaceae bacterium]|nr:fatty acid desaturase family protein [Burkholderiaceae bacterium]